MISKTIHVHKLFTSPKGINERGEFTNIRQVLESAYDKVSNCECGEETSCYGCLRNYNNQIFHEKIQRGLAKEYLCGLLGK